MIWLDALDDREQKEVKFPRVYRSIYHHGTDGHHRMMLIARLVALLDTTEADLRTAQGQCKIFEEMVLDAVAQLGDVGTPLPVSIARLKSELLAARRVADRLTAWIEGEGFCPICGARLDKPHADGCALAIYEQVRKEGLTKALPPDN